MIDRTLSGGFVPTVAWLTTAMFFVCMSASDVLYDDYRMLFLLLSSQFSLINFEGILDDS